MKRIVGEYHELPVTVEHGRINGAKHYDRGMIHRRLSDAGFSVEFPSSGPMGLFFATRK
jgi:hypothetical protein